MKKNGYILLLVVLMVPASYYAQETNATRFESKIPVTITSQTQPYEILSPELQAEIDFLKIQYLSSDEVLNEAKDLHSRWPQLNHDEKRKIIESITDRISVGQDDIHINFSYLPVPEMMTTGLQSQSVPPSSMAASSRFAYPWNTPCIS